MPFEVRSTLNRQEADDDTTARTGFDKFIKKNIRVTDRSVAGEVANYLRDPREDIECIKIYPRLSVLFRELNTVLPSSAACERLFSKGKWLFRRNRHSLSDARFEQQLLLNANKDLL